MTSKLGLWLAGVYLVLCAYLILTQGLFGESFIAIILGAPWSFSFAFFEYLGAESLPLTLLLLAPITFNVFLLFWLGKLISCKIVNMKS